jgi:hypothetical protein
MRPWSAVFAVFAASAVAFGVAAAGDDDSVPLYTGEDLDRMFGPVPAAPSEPVDKSRPEDWRWVEEFLARQYSRIDADRQFELSSRSLEIDEHVAYDRHDDGHYGHYGGYYGGPYAGYYGGYASLGLGYPASTWWNRVSSAYSSGTSGASCATRGDRFQRTAGGMSRGRDFQGGGHGGRGAMSAGRPARMR